MFCLGALLLPTSAGVWAQETTDPFEIEKAAYLAAETNSERLEIMQTFLNDYPQHEKAGFVTENAVRILVDSMDNYHGAIKLAQKQLAAAGDSEVKPEIQDILIELYGRPGFADDLAQMVAQRYDFQTMIYTEHLAVLRAATKAEAWIMVDKYAQQATPLATPDAFRAAYPEREFTDEYIQEAGQNRQGLLKTFTGWAAANLGDEKRAKQDFKAASSLVRKNFFGLPDNDLYLYWGQSQIRFGEPDQGQEKLALLGIFGANSAAAEKARKTYLESGKTEAQYEKFIWNLRQKHSVKMVDFKAVGYQGDSPSYNQLKGKKATLLAFWFPT